MADSKDTGITSKQIIVTGKVQGVGFRPFLSRLAAACGISGSARNAGGRVEIRATAAPAALADFVARIRTDAPPAAEIFEISVSGADIADGAGGAGRHAGFTIEPSGTAAGIIAPMPDLAVCDSCVAEMFDTSDPRYLHPFISCTECGPRFSIMREVPYDRANTSMAQFPLCGSCGGEYGDISDRRCHSQTIACNDCGPALTFIPAGSCTPACDGEDPIEKTVRAVKAGRVVAVKGIGGFHLAADPFNDEAVAALRGLKGRDAKPFALMFESLEAAEKHAVIGGAERELLTSPARPIVLLDRRDGGTSGISSAVFGSAERIGIFLPYTPVHHLLLRELKAIVLTSANLSGNPIISSDSEILGLGVDVLTNDRDIINPQDDSVVQTAGEAGFPVFIRRARGYVPDCFRLPGPGSNAKPIFAAGGDLKAAFCMTDGRENYAYMSQYLGDLYDMSAAGRYAETVRKFRKVLRIDPQAAVCDLHPAYASSALAAGMGLPTLKVQHHFAHAASVMAEHGLQDKTIGVVFDGTGYGDDSGIWGGEILVCEGDLSGYRRAARLRETVLIGGDSAASDARKSALSFLLECGIAPDPELLYGLSTKEKGVLTMARKAGINTFRSTSMGRLFDAVSCLLGICGENSYEAECAMLLEARAHAAGRAADRAADLAFGLARDRDCIIIDYEPVLRGLIDLRKSNADTGAASAGFHIALAEAVRRACVEIKAQDGTNIVALSGGVFQNRFLLSETLRRLREDGFEAYTNVRVPANDGGIALGQAYIAMGRNF